MRDDDIVELLRQRDQQGLYAFEQKYSPMLRYILSPFLTDPREQEECLSDISLLVWEKIHLYDAKKSQFKTWLTVLARNTAIDRSRRNQRLPITQELTPDIVSPEDSPETRVINQERSLAFKRTLDKLSTTDRILFYRKYYYFQSTAQIAAELRMTERAVEGRLYRLKKRLHKLFRRYNDE